MLKKLSKKLETFRTISSVSALLSIGFGSVGLAWLSIWITDVEYLDRPSGLMHLVSVTSFKPSSKTPLLAMFAVLPLAFSTLSLRLRNSRRCDFVIAMAGL